MSRIARFWLLATLALVAVTALGYFLRGPDPNCRINRWPYGWLAASIKHPSEHDIWIEFNVDSHLPSRVFRDYDGDGVVDEVMWFLGAMTFVSAGMDSSGRVTGYRYITMPLDSVDRVSEKSSENEAGPFTRSNLDEWTRQNPYIRTR